MTSSVIEVGVKKVWVIEAVALTVSVTCRVCELVTRTLSVVVAVANAVVRAVSMMVVVGVLTVAVVEMETNWVSVTDTGTMILAIVATPMNDVAGVLMVLKMDHVLVKMVATVLIVDV